MMLRAGAAASIIISSDAKLYVLVDNVSKLNGLMIKVAGNSLIMSMNNNMKAVIKPGSKIGR